MKRMLTLSLIALLWNGLTAQGQESPQRALMASVSHFSVYSTDLKKTEQFYVHDLGATRGADPQDPAGVRYYFSPVQMLDPTSILQTAYARR